MDLVESILKSSGTSCLHNGHVRSRSIQLCTQTKQITWPQGILTGSFPARPSRHTGQVLTPYLKQRKYRNNCVESGRVWWERRLQVYLSTKVLTEECNNRTCVCCYVTSNVSNIVISICLHLPALFLTIWKWKLPKIMIWLLTIYFATLGKRRALKDIGR